MFYLDFLTYVCTVPPFQRFVQWLRISGVTVPVITRQGGVNLVTPTTERSFRTVNTLVMTVLVFRMVTSARRASAMKD